ncbi:hypothetical protein B0H13DRAFT_1957078 [Mycena leptocephala]|nr:hypothetical protein B0H13DRAFT_1957078 [Mycena leptocephala]
MSGVSEASLSLLQSTAPTSGMTYVIVGVLCLTAWMAYITSPMRLTAALVDALHETEEAHLWAIEAGVLSGLDVHTKMLSETLLSFHVVILLLCHFALAFFVCAFCKAIGSVVCEIQRKMSRIMNYRHACPSREDTAWIFVRIGASFQPSQSTNERVTSREKKILLDRGCFKLSRFP